MNSESVISVQSVTKTFRIAKSRPNSLKERFIRANRAEHADFTALSDVTFGIERGTAVGILGHNGSGKSTLMKCIAGIMYPTSGSISTRGRVVPLLELGAGFQPDLTGTENIFMNAAILGMTKKKVNEIFESIVEFSELEEFLNVPVRHYSSGMYARLGFSIAIHVEPEVVIFDEVLAVGDEAFQKKCLDRVRSLLANGTTMLLVTHSVAQIEAVCDRAIVLSHGRLIADGPPSESIVRYRASLNERGQ
jgi:ABC-2 type transport system ATP-binding protein